MVDLVHFGGMGKFSCKGCASQDSAPAGFAEHTCGIESIVINVRESKTIASGFDAIKPAVCLGPPTENLERSIMSVDMVYLKKENQD